MNYLFSLMFWAVGFILLVSMFSWDMNPKACVSIAIEDVDGGSMNEVINNHISRICK